MTAVKKINFCILLFSLLISCSNNKGEFIIVNESDFDIDSLSIMPDSKKQFIYIEKGSKIKYSIAMDEVSSDGSYFISFRNVKDNKRIEQRFGYYTNGYQTEKEIVITIKNDTILFKSNFNSY
ncbi:hypothetical protein [uncultured Winogradskyella sp.]|uniref:hypothetical protein n=1 Tax=uncultured Winogradskyella sp. TaxID=395353 RepID=UPI00260DAB47|nr:hypothetical protein [uncultured Winogradskyella sp.]